VTDSSLKDFQRATVAHVVEHLYGPGKARRFLVADEVGLGKTMVARGVMSHAIEHLKRTGVKRIDVVYVCSNAEIARQNLRRLNVTGRDDVALAARITLLPLELHRLTGTAAARRHINIISFTPGTSLEFGLRTGVARERALLLRLLRQAWGIRAGAGAKELMRVDCGRESFRRIIAEVDGAALDKKLAARFAAALAKDQTGLRDAWEHLRSRYGAGRANRGDREDRRRLVSSLRGLLARVCVEALEPDLVILDEFQRFRTLLDPSTEIGELANALFAFPDVRVLLLSATPYKLYTVAGDDAEDHYSDLLATYRFLVEGNEQAVEELRQALGALRGALLRLGEHDGYEAVIAARDRAQAALRERIVRTERLSVPTADPMGRDVEARGVTLAAEDVRSFRDLAGLGRALGSATTLIEYWKSAPYLLEFMEGYDLSRRLERAVERGDDISLPRHGRLRWSDVERYQRIDPGNARMRALYSDTIDAGIWRMLWIPPALPYWQLEKPFSNDVCRTFTKRLVFSSWTVAPRAIAGMLSYAAEQAMVCSLRRVPYERARVARLQFAWTAGRHTGMPVLTIVHPLPGLARTIDPRALAASHARKMGASPTIDELRRAAAAELRAKLEPVLARAPVEGPVDERWYWAAPLLLDSQPPHSDPTSFRGLDLEEADANRFADHLAEADDVIQASRDGASLGRPPEDLIDVLADTALGGPGVCAYRALRGIAPQASEDAIVRAAARVGWGARSLFNTDEVSRMIRGLPGRSGVGKVPYWRKVLAYAVDGCLAAVLDEYAHVLVEHLALQDAADDVRVDGLASTMHDAIALRASQLGVREYAEIDGVPQPAAAHHLRTRFALRFGDERSDDVSGAQRRATGVRVSFNSPFWPFILATTSVGQEGLDFHLYSHAVVHWNLPSNPVDLEQREGRVNRYKNHAVRRNVAQVHRDVGVRAGGDPWQAMFEAAVRSRPIDSNDLVPWWISTAPGGAMIERHVPTLPLSRDVARYRQLRRRLALYRLAFGQPRQEDLVEYLEHETATILDDDALAALRIDLSPAGAIESVADRARLAS
jgi:hypothetical protein